MQFTFLRHNLAQLLSHTEHLESPSQIIKKFGPYLMTSLFNQELEESKLVMKYMDQNIDQSNFIRNLTPDPSTKNWRTNYRKSLESLVCSLIVDNQNLIDKNYTQTLKEDQITLSEALPLAYTLVIQRVKQWNLTNEKEALARLNFLLQSQKPEHQKINITVLYQKQFLSDLGHYYPEFLNQSQGRIYSTELPIDFFIGHLQEPFQDFFIKDNLLVDLKVGDQIYMFMFPEEFENQTTKSFLLKYVRLKNLQTLYPNAKVIWCYKGIEKSEILQTITG